MPNSFTAFDPVLDRAGPCKPMQPMRSHAGHAAKTNPCSHAHLDLSKIMCRHSHIIHWRAKVKTEGGPASKWAGVGSAFVGFVAAQDNEAVTETEGDLALSCWILRAHSLAFHASVRAARLMSNCACASWRCLSDQRALSWAALARAYTQGRCKEEG